LDKKNVQKWISQKSLPQISPPNLHVKGPKTVNKTINPLQNVEKF